MNIFRKVMMFATMSLLMNTNGYAGFSTTNIQLLAGNDYEIGDQKREIVTLEHASNWSHGDNFFFFDVTNPTSDSTDIYGEYLTRFKMYKNITLAASMEWGNDFRTYLGGVGIDLAIPHFTFFKVNLLARDNPKVDGSTFQVTLSWYYKKEFSKTDFVFEGFLDYAGEEGTKKANLITAPRFLFDISKTWGRPGKVYTGIEYQYWKNKFGIDGVTESVPQAMILWVL